MFIVNNIYISSVSNAIVDQLLLDIDHVCSVSGEEDLSSLKKYILNDRGWRCLTVLHLLGTQVSFFYYINVIVIEFVGM